MMDAGVDFVARDQPFASRLTLHILAAVAEDEARRISERTKAALKAAKASRRAINCEARPWLAKPLAEAGQGQDQDQCRGLETGAGEDCSEG